MQGSAFYMSKIVTEALSWCWKICWMDIKKSKFFIGMNPGNELKYLASQAKKSITSWMRNTKEKLSFLCHLLDLDILRRKVIRSSRIYVIWFSFSLIYSFTNPQQPCTMNITQLGKKFCSTNLISYVNVMRSRFLCYSIAYLIKRKPKVMQHFFWKCRYGREGFKWCQSLWIEWKGSAYIKWWQSVASGLILVRGGQSLEIFSWRNYLSS